MRELSSHQLPVIDFYFESEIFDHSPNFRRWGAWCCQVAVHEDRVGRIEGQRLQTAEVVLPSAGDTDLRARVEKTEQAEHFQASLRREVIAMFQWGACYRMEAY